MHLGICAQRLAIVQTGVARYLANLLAEWTQKPLPFKRVTLFSPRPLMGVAARYSQVIGGTRWPHFVWEHLWIPLQARRHQIDVLFCPGYVVPLGYRGRCVVTIHDVMQAAIPQDFPFSARLHHAPLYRYSARRADKILTVSVASFQDIQSYYRVPPSRIVVIPLAAEATFHPGRDDDGMVVRERYQLGQAPLILFVGKFSRRRHLPALIEAFARLVQQNRVPHLLVLVGVNPLHVPIEQLAQNVGVGNRVVHIGYVPNDDLARLYRSADVFIYPSEMEGFGLPVLEAMASGTPVITLRRPVLIEVAGDAAWYAETGTPAALHAAMEAVVGDNALREELRRKGLERAHAFSWAGTAQRTLEVLLQVASGAQSCQ